MNSVGSRFHWVSSTCRIHVLRLQADMWSKVFIPLTSVAEFPLIWIRLKMHPSFSNCCLPKSTSDLCILPVLCVTISDEGPAVHNVSAIMFSGRHQDKSKWGMRNPSNRSSLSSVRIWCVVNSLLAVTAYGSICLLMHVLCADKRRRMKSCLYRLAGTWTCAVLTHECPRVQMCCQHHHKDCVRSLLSCLTFSN